MTRRLLFAASAVVLACSVAACATTTSAKTAAPKSAASTTSAATSTSPEPAETTDPPKANTKNLPLGTEVTSTDSDSTLTVSATVVKTSRKALSQYGEAPKGTYAGIDVTYVCVTGSCTYNPFDFTMRAADGSEVQSAFEGFAPELHSGNLTAGVKARGFLTYDVTPGTYSLEYGASVFDSDPASWVVTVA